MYTAYPTQPPQMGVEPPQGGVMPEPQAKPKAPAKSKENDIGSFIQQLIGLASYVHQLQVQAHLMHFNYEAGNFLGVHKFLGKQYEKHQEQFDKIGEFIRSMDYYTKKIEAISAKVHALDIQNYMAELCGDAFKDAWMVKATMRNG
jgi:hypothetical protein